jgi:hypothetical protein
VPPCLRVSMAKPSFAIRVICSRSAGRGETILHHPRPCSEIARRLMGVSVGVNSCTGYSPANNSLETIRSISHLGRQPRTVSSWRCSRNCLPWALERRQIQPAEFLDGNDDCTRQLYTRAHPHHQFLFASLEPEAKQSQSLAGGFARIRLCARLARAERRLVTIY